MIPLVSIITPTFDRLAFLKEMVASVQAQTFQDWELLITDDGSRDGTAAWLADVARSDVRISFQIQENAGQGAARNRAIRRARGSLLAFLDSDDLWSPGKLSAQIAYLESHPELDFCYTADLERSEDGREEVVLPPATHLPHLKRCGKPTSVPSSHVYRRASFDQVGFFDEDPDLRGLEDNEWSLRGHDLAGGLLPEPLTVYRKHGGQITRDNVRLARYGRALEKILLRHRAIVESDPQALRFRVLQLVNTWLLAGDGPHGRRVLEDAAFSLSPLERLAFRGMLRIPSPVWRFLRGR